MRWRSLYGPDVNPVVELLASSAVALSAPTCRAWSTSPHDIEARTELALWRLACRGLPRRGRRRTWLAQRVRQAFGLDHSHCHAIFTPYAIAFNAKAAPHAMDLIARALGGKRCRPGLYDLNVRIGMPTGLKDLGMKEADIPKAVDLVAAAKFVNPRPVSRDDIVNLITQAFHGEPSEF